MPFDSPALASAKVLPDSELFKCAILSMSRIKIFLKLNKTAERCFAGVRPHSF